MTHPAIKLRAIETIANDPFWIFLEGEEPPTELAEESTNVTVGFFGLLFLSLGVLASEAGLLNWLI